MRRVTDAPRTQAFDVPRTNDWFGTVTERMNVYSGTVNPTVNEIPENQWVLFYNISQGTVSLFANVAGALYNLSTSSVEIINIKDPPYNAKGDGSTDDKSAIQSALTAMGTLGGGVVYFPPGTYMLSSSVQPPTGVKMIGVEGLSILKCTAASTSVKTVQAGNVTNIGFFGLTFDGNVTNNTNTNVLFQMFNVQDWVVDRCIFQNTIRIGMNLSTNLQNVRITNSKFKNIGYTTGVGGTEAWQAIAFSGTGHDSIFITDNVFDQIGLDVLSLSNMTNVVVRNNRTSDTCYTFLYIVNGSGVSRAVIDGNVIKSQIGQSQTYPLPSGVKTPSMGIDAPSLTDAIISNNIITGTASAGIGLFPGSARVKVVNNICMNNNQIPDGVGNDVIFQAGIVVRGYTGSTSSPTDIYIDGNICKDTQTTKTQRYGLLISSDAILNVKVGTNNNFSGNRDGDIAEFVYPTSTSAGTLVSSWNQWSLTQSQEGLSFNNFSVYYGSGAPTMTAPKGSLYLRSDGSSTSTRAYINTDGATSWTAITTAT